MQAGRSGRGARRSPSWEPAGRRRRRRRRQAVPRAAALVRACPSRVPPGPHRSVTWYSHDEASRSWPLPALSSLGVGRPQPPAACSCTACHEADQTVLQHRVNHANGCKQCTGTAVTHCKTVHTRNRQAPGAYVPPRAPRALTLPSTPPRHQGTCQALLSSCLPVAARVRSLRACQQLSEQPGEQQSECTEQPGLPRPGGAVVHPCPNLACLCQQGGAVPGPPRQRCPLAHAQTAPCAPPTSLLPPAAPARVPVLPNAAAPAPKAAAPPPLVPPLVPCPSSAPAPDPFNLEAVPQVYWNRASRQGQDRPAKPTAHSPAPPVPACPPTACPPSAATACSRCPPLPHRPSYGCVRVSRASRARIASPSLQQNGAWQGGREGRHRPCALLRSRASECPVRSPAHLLLKPAQAAGVAGPRQAARQGCCRRW